MHLVDQDGPSKTRKSKSLVFSMLDQTGKVRPYEETTKKNDWCSDGMNVVIQRNETDP